MSATLVHPTRFDYSSPVGIVLAMEPFHVGQRVKFEDPDTFDPRIGQGFEARGRVTFELIVGTRTFFQVIPDGKRLGVWLSANEIQGE